MRVCAGMLTIRVRTMVIMKVLKGVWGRRVVTSRHLGVRARMLTIRVRIMVIIQDGNNVWRKRAVQTFRPNPKE